jgi:Putative Actinobacterial Holin-X, holin superfamily III
VTTVSMREHDALSSPDHPQATPPTDESVGNLVSEVAGDLSTLMRQELALARAELREEAVKAAKGGGLVGAAGLAGWMVLLFVSLTAVWALDEAMDTAWAALIVTGVWALIGVGLYLAGRARLREVSPVPAQTIEQLKEDKRWMTGQSS